MFRIIHVKMTLNLNGIDLLKEFKYVVGFSDHTSNDIGAIVFGGKGCKIIENILRWIKIYLVQIIKHL